MGAPRYVLRGEKKDGLLCRRERGIYPPPKKEKEKEMEMEKGEVP